MRKEVALSVGEIRLAGEADMDSLRRMIGVPLERVLKVDSTPMLLLSTNLLDRGDIRNGEQSWVAGHYQIWVTERQFVNEFAPILLGGPGYRGHLSNEEWAEAAMTVLWAGMDPKSGTPAAISYVYPTAEDVRATVRRGIALGTLKRELNQSLFFNCAIDEKTLQIVQFLDEDRTGLDLVRAPGTESAGVKEAIALKDKGKEKPMPYQFNSISEIFDDSEIKKMIESRARQIAESPDEVRKIVLAAPVEIIKGREDVKPYFERPTREEVVKSLTEAELEVALAAKPDLKKKAVAICEVMNEKVAKFREETARPILEGMKIPKDRVDVTLAGHDFSHMDPERVKEVGRTITLALGIKVNAGETEKKETPSSEEEMPPMFTKNPSNW